MCCSLPNITVCSPVRSVENNIPPQVRPGKVPQVGQILNLGAVVGGEGVGSVLVFQLDHDDRAAVFVQVRPHYIEEDAPPLVDVAEVVGVVGPHLHVGVELLQPEGQAAAVDLPAHVGAHPQEHREAEALGGDSIDPVRFLSPCQAVSCPIEIGTELQEKKNVREVARNVPNWKCILFKWHFGDWGHFLG